jgi:hypothetical protein
MVAHSHTQMREAVFYSIGRAACERFEASSGQSSPSAADLDMNVIVMARGVAALEFQDR